MLLKSGLLKVSRREGQTLREDLRQDRQNTTRIIEGNMSIFQNNDELDTGKVVKRWVMTLRSPDGTLYPLCNTRVGALNDELIRLRDGHGYTVVSSPKKVKGLLGKSGNFYPFAKE